MMTSATKIRARIAVEFLLLKVSRSTRLPGAASTHWNQVVYKKICNISAIPVFTKYWSAILTNEQFINANNNPCVFGRELKRATLASKARLLHGQWREASRITQ